MSSSPSPAAASAQRGRPGVLLLSTYYHPIIGGVETQARQIARALHAAGLGVTVVTRRTPASRPAHDVVDGVDVHAIAPAGDRNTVGKWAAVVPAVAAAWRLRREFDAIFCIDFRSIGIAAIAAGRVLRRPVVLQAETPGALSHAHWDGSLARIGVAPGSRLGRVVKRPLTALYASADDQVAISRDIERETLAVGVPRDRVHYIPHSVDVTRFRPFDQAARAARRRELGWPVDRTIAMFVGRLSREKGILDLMAAWAALADRRAILVVVGPDMTGHRWDAGPAARQMAVDQGMADRVIFHGSTDDPAPLLQAADIFVQPSHFEAFGLSAIEALATGLPVVGSGVGGLLDFLEDGRNALLCPPGDPPALAACLDRILADPPMQAAMRLRARETAATRFDAAVIGAEYVALMRSVIGRSGRPGA